MAGFQSISATVYITIISQQKKISFDREKKKMFQHEPRENHMFLSKYFSNIVDTFHGYAKYFD